MTEDHSEDLRSEALRFMHVCNPEKAYAIIISPDGTVAALGTFNEPTTARSMPIEDTGAEIRHIGYLDTDIIRRALDDHNHIVPLLTEPLFEDLNFEQGKPLNNLVGYRLP